MSSPGSALRTALFLLCGLLLIGLTGCEDDAAKSPVDEAPPPESPPQPTLADESRFGADGVLLGIRSMGWNVVRQRDPVEFRDHSTRAVIFERGGLEVDATVYEIETRAAFDRIRGDIDPDHGTVAFDHVLFEVRPSEPRARGVADALREDLQRLREALLEDD